MCQHIDIYFDINDNPVSKNCNILRRKLYLFSTTNIVLKSKKEQEFAMKL